MPFLDSLKSLPEVAKPRLTPLINHTSTQCIMLSVRNSKLDDCSKRSPNTSREVCIGGLEDSCKSLLPLDGQRRGALGKWNWPMMLDPWHRTLADR